MDFNIENKSEFEDFCKAIETLDYKCVFDSEIHQREHMVRYTSDKYGVDIVDFRYPTWNCWSITDKMKRRATLMKFGKLELIIPDAETIFLFKSYPLRAKDISDLRALCERYNKLSSKRIIDLYEEQETLLEKRTGDLTDIDPVLTVLRMRMRFYLSMHELSKLKKDKIIKELFDFGKKKFDTLDIRENEEKIIQKIRSGESIDKLEDKYYENFHKTWKNEGKEASQ